MRLKLHLVLSTTNHAVSRLENPSREKMRHLRCLCFVRPSPDSIQLLIDELREPKYGEYYICEKIHTLIGHGANLTRL